jgi:hypothetical protein
MSAGNRSICSLYFVLGASSQGIIVASSHL